MDAILLNSTSQTDPLLDDEFFVQKKYAPKNPKGKTKWKAYEYEDDKKIYGKFACKNCTAKWGTARHVLNQSQKCLRKFT